MFLKKWAEYMISNCIVQILCVFNEKWYKKAHEKMLCNSTGISSYNMDIF